MKVKMSVMILCAAMVTLAGCATAPVKPESKAVLRAESDEAIAIFRAKDLGIERFFQSSYGYAVLPKIFKGAFWVGGAYGRGQVYEQGQMIGFCSMSQATLGFSFGGEFFREIIFFRDKNDLGRFMNGEYTFSAQATGVAATAGAAAKADYRDGMAVFITTDKGLMVDASLGGQRFTYAPGVVIEDTTK
jgi:lipid-binding SYLF domain-containing protein